MGFNLRIAINKYDGDDDVIFRIDTTIYTKYGIDNMINNLNCNLLNTAHMVKSLNQPPVHKADKINDDEKKKLLPYLVLNSNELNVFLTCNSENEHMNHGASSTHTRHYSDDE